MIATRVTHMSAATNLRAGTPEHTEGALLAQGWKHSGATAEELAHHGLLAILEHPQLPGDRLYVNATAVDVPDEQAGQ